MEMELVCCSICSKSSSDCEVVDEVTTELLGVLLIDIKTKFGSDTHRCSDCKNELLKCFDFKGKCIYTEDFIYPYIDAENDTKVDIETIYLKKTGLDKRHAKPDKLKICRLCIKRVDGHFYNISEDTLRKYKVDEKFFQKFLPEVNLKVTEAPIMCEECLTCLRRFSKFVSCIPMAKEVSLNNTKNENKGTSSRINKPNICKYCKQTKTNLRRHIESLHKNEAEVKEFMKMTDDNPKKLELLGQIRRDGNFVAFKEDRKIVPSRLMSGNNYLDEKNYIACSECKQILKKPSLGNHLRNSCTKSYSTSVKVMLERSNVISESIHIRANGIVRDLLFPAFREGPVKEAIRFDELIILYANDMTSEYTSPDYYPLIRDKMITMAKVLLKMKSLYKSVQTFKDVLKPQIFDNLMEVIKCMGEFNELTGNYEKPAVHTELKTSLKYMTKLFISDCIQNNNTEEKSLAKGVLYLLQTELPDRADKTKSESLLEGKWKNVVRLPSFDDITKLIRYILTQRNNYFSKLNVKFDLDSWINLSSYTLISILIFSWRRPCELDKSLVSNLDSLRNIGEEKEILKQFNSSDQAQIREYVRFVIKRGVSVLLDKTMNECLKLLVKYRKEAGVIDNNPYLFALPQCRQEYDEEIIFRHLHATSLMRQYSVACGAINPKTLTAATLKKVATISLTLNSNNEEFQHWKGYLRHADQIDLEYDRQPMSDRDLLTVFKILLAAQGDYTFFPNAAAMENQSTDLEHGTSATTSISDTTAATKIQGTDVSSRLSVASTITDSIKSKSTSEFLPSNDDPTDEDMCSVQAISSKSTHKRRRTLAVTPGFSVANRTWTIPEKKAVKKMFAHYITKKNLPTNLEISNAIKNCPVLKNLTISQIKLWIYSGKKTVTPGFSVANRTWTIPEKKAVKNMFAHYITKKNLPTNLEISNAIKNCPVLKNLTISQIKLWIYSGKKSLMSNLNPANIKKNPKRRNNNKPKNVCKYCKKKKSKIRRHIEALHKNEAEVKKFMMMTDDNPKKLELLAQIRRDGNFAAFKRNRKIVPSRLPSETNKLDYYACPNCKSILKKDSLRNHLKVYCTKNFSKSVRGMLRRSKAISESIHARANDIVREFLFPAFRDGPVKEAIRFDELIILYANELTSKYRSQHHFLMIRNKMIRMAKVLLKIKSFDESVQTFRDILKPQIFDNLMKVINYLGEYNEVTKIYEKPTLPTEVGISLKSMTKLFISECIKNNNMEEQSLAENLLHLLQTTLPDLVNKTINESLLKQKSRKVVVVPSMEDKTKLICYVVMQRNKHFSKLTVNFDLESWIDLSNYTLISTLIFNRLKPGELERSLVSNLDSSTNIGEESEIFKQLNSSDKAYIQGYVRFSIRGGVYVLLDKSMNECLKLLMKYRKNAGVVDNNPYIFALPQCGQECDEQIIFRHLHATPLMKLYSEACGAANPKTLRSTTLRKQVTTMNMRLDSSNEEIQHLQGYLTHAEKIQREYYKQPISELDDILNISRILLAAQGDLSVYVNTAATNNQGTDLLAPTPCATTTISDRIRTSEYVPSNDDSYDENLDRAEDISPKPTQKRQRLVAKTPGPPVAKRIWSVSEKQATRRIFAHYIKEKKLPSDYEISKAIKNCSELKHRTFAQIRSWIYNCKKAQPEFRAELNLKPEGRTPWSEEQASLVKRHFKENISSKRAPKKEECLKLIEKYPEVLHNKDWNVLNECLFRASHNDPTNEDKLIIEMDI